ncbi:MULTISPECIES: hypothetical protein [Frankia]|uniref:hypothetical protein n=1 Tax=Frankia TaxID=1854 RepID=UPI0002E8930F|nr:MULTISPECIES: hypothetical protein [Frankia]
MMGQGGPRGTGGAAPAIPPPEDPTTGSGTGTGAGGARRWTAGWAATRTGRIARATVAALLTVGLAVAAHVLACGRAPAVAVVLVGIVLVLRVCWGVSERRVSMSRLVGLVLAVQGCLHVAFGLSAPAGHAGHAGIGGGADHAGLAAASPADLVPGGAAMLGLHLAAALLLAGWLALGERLLWQAARGAVRVARRAVGRLHRPRPAGGVPATVASQRILAISRPPDAACSLWLRHVVVRRGPPRLAARQTAARRGAQASVS